MHLVAPKLPAHRQNEVAQIALLGVVRRDHGRKSVDQGHLQTRIIPDDRSFVTSTRAW